MNKTAKIILITIITLLLAFAIALTSLVTLINPNDFKTEISQLVKEKIHRELTIKGDIAWSFFPWAGFRVSDIELSNAPGFEEHTFLKAGEVDASVRLLPLLLGEIKMGAVRLADVQLHLIRNQDGVANWEDLDHHLRQKSEASPRQTQHLIGLTISTVHLINTKVTWQDKQNNHDYLIQGLELRSKNLSLNEPFTVNLNAYIKDNTTDFKANIAASVLAHLDLEKQRYSLKNMHLSITPRQAPFDKHPLTINIKTNALADINAQTLIADNIQAYTEHLQCRGKLSVNNLAHTPTFEGNIEILPFNPGDLLEEFGQGQAVANAPDNLSGQAIFKGTSHRLHVTSLDVTMDASKIKGAVAINDWAKKRIDLQLNIDNLDLNPYTKSQTNEVAQPTKTEPSALTTWLKTAEITGNITVGKLNTAHLKLKQLSAPFNLHTGVMNIAPIRANLYGGKTQLRLAWDIRQTTPRYTVQGDIDQVDLAKLIKDLTGKAMLTGTGKISAALHTAGSHKQQLIGNLNGKGNLILTKGYIQGIDAAFELQRADAIIKKQSTPKGRSKPPRTNYDKITADFRIRRGVFTTQNAALTDKQLKTTTVGKINLNNQTLNMAVKATGTHIITQNGQPVRQFNTWHLPIRITGKLTSPLVTPDFASIGIKLIQDKVTKEVGKHIKEVGDKIDDVLGDAIDKLF